MTYSARTAYRNRAAIDAYEEHRFSGVLGRYRWRREQAAVRSALKGYPSRQTVLDCPIGFGRWAPLLVERGHKVIGVDISPAMLGAASERLSNTVAGGSSALSLGAAEHLPLSNLSVDIVFSFALTKHLPPEALRATLIEFARVSRIGIVTSISICDGLSGKLWSARNIFEGYAVRRAELVEFVEELQFSMTSLRRCTTRIGVEHLAVLHRHRG